jgi:nitrogen fixation protein FixH
MSRTRGWYWPWLVSAALLFTVGVNVVMFVAASSDLNGSVVEPDYYRKAVEWDRTMARRAASDSLGWRTTARFERGPADSVLLVVAATAADGGPLTGVRFTATLIHNLDAARPVRVALTERAEGRYVAPAPRSHRGLWEVRLEGRRDAARYVNTAHTDMP